MDIDIPYVRAEAVYQCIYVLRIHRQTAHIVIPHIHKLLESGFIEDVKCRSAVIWMIGEYASDIDTSPYLLETIVPLGKNNSYVSIRFFYDEMLGH